MTLGKTYTVPMAYSDLHQGRGLIYSQRCRLLTREQTPARFEGQTDESRLSETACAAAVSAGFAVGVQASEALLALPVPSQVQQLVLWFAIQSMLLTIFQVN